MKPSEGRTFVETRKDSAECQEQVIHYYRALYNLQIAYETEDETE